MAHFRFETEIPGLRCVFDPDEVLEFRYTSPAPIVVSIKARDRQGGHLSGLFAVCTATTTIEIARTLKEEIDGVIEGDRLSATKIKPDALKFIDDILLNLLSPCLRSTIIILNWTHGLDSLPDPFGTSSGSYSEDGERWFGISLARSIGLDLSSATHTIYARNIRVDDVRSKVEAGAEEPLGRQLFREAWSLMGTNPRSALVIGVAAAEVGLKRLIGTLIPAANWLVQEIQTPPVRKILHDFLPTLPIKARRLDGGPITPPRTLIREIERAVKHRNKIVHVGAPPPAKDELAKMLIAISDLLWLCDVYTGEHWATKHVSLETKKNWPSKSS
jgi:hypothetical protein